MPLEYSQIPIAIKAFLKNEICLWLSGLLEYIDLNKTTEGRTEGKTILDG